MVQPRAPIQSGDMRGFTLIELMVTVAVLAVLLAIAAPSFASLLASNRMSTQANEFIGALNLARSEAVRRAKPVAVRSNDADNYAKGWKVFSDSDADGDIPGSATAEDGTVIREASAFSGTPTVKRQTCTGSPCAYADSAAADRVFLVFNARGGIAATSDAYFKVCDPSNTSVKGRRIKVNAVGKISLLGTNETCP